MDACKTAMAHRLRPQRICLRYQEITMTDQELQSGSAPRDFAEGEERNLPGAPRDFAEGEERNVPGAPRDFAEGQEDPSSHTA
jgi:hypothetical protein